MASQEEGEKDEMDSLFDGMVLFNPFQVANDDDDHVHQVQEQLQEQSISISEGASSSSVSQPLPLDENLFSDLTLITPPDPLQLPAPAPADTISAAATVNNNNTSTTITTTSRSCNREEEVLPLSLSRQPASSTRKKKRAGLRIGYGRDAAYPIPDYDDQQQHTHAPSLESDPIAPLSPPPLSHLESSGSAPHQVKQQREEEEEDAEKSVFSDNTCTSKQVDASPSTVAYGDDDDGDCMVSSDAQPTGTGTVVSWKRDLQINSRARFEQIRVQISEKLSDVREVVASVSAARKDSTRRRRKASDALNLATTRYRQREKELEEACEAEDFETAESVSSSLASADKDKEHLATALRLAEADCDAVDSKMQEVLKRQIAVEEECSSLLKNFSMDAVNDAGHLINAARLVLSDSIERSVEDDRREKKLLRRRKEILTGELERLLALVKEKEMEIAKTDNNIEAAEKRIADVVSSFQEVQSSVYTMYDNLRSSLSQVELDNEALARKRMEIDDFLSQGKDRGIKLQELAQISANEANVFQEGVELRKSLVLFIVKSREDKVRLAKTEDKILEDVHMLRQEISAARASLQELSSTKSSFQQEIESLKQRLVFIDKRVPDLEAEKKVSAAARNFKEAARIATESKMLSVEKESLQTKLAGAILELGKLEEDMRHTVYRLQETEGQISTQEKEVAMARSQRLLLIAGAAKAERAAALELGDLEEADILLAEAEAAEAEARKIQLLYNFTEEEFANLPKQYIPMELVSNLGGQQLAELAASAYIST